MGEQLSLFGIKWNAIVYFPLMKSVATQGFALMLIFGFGFFKAYYIAHTI